MLQSYPHDTPFVKFGGFEIRRDASHRGGDFITYFRDVKIIYDRAVLHDEYPPDIDNEDVWGLIREREDARRMREMERFGLDQILRMIEGQRQAGPAVFTPTEPVGE